MRKRRNRRQQSRGRRHAENDLLHPACHMNCPFLNVLNLKNTSSQLTTLICIKGDRYGDNVGARLGGVCI
jgi:hypothetical protein